MEYQINRKVKGSRTFFFPTVNGKRLSNTNFARKYDAVNLVNQIVAKYGVDRVLQICNGGAK